MNLRRTRLPPAFLRLLFPAFLGWVLTCAVPAQEAADRIAFDAAVRTLEGGFASKAAADFAAFTQAHPQSPFVQEAVLLQARALAQDAQLDTAIQLLRERMETLGALKDRGLYLLGDILQRKGAFAEAAEAFSQVPRDFPASPLVLNAAFSEALVRFRAGDYPAAAALLAGTQTAFGKAAQEQPNAEVTVRGQLLLAESLLRAGSGSEARQALDRLTNRPLTPAQSWEHAWLGTSLLLSNRQADAAIAAATHLVGLATNAASREFLARSHRLQGEVLRQAGRIPESFAALTNNLQDTTPPEWRRDAVLAIAELPLPPSLLQPVSARLLAIAAAPDSDPAAAAARVAVAELKLQQYFGGSPPATNLLGEARGLLQGVLTNAAPAVLTARAWFDLGWCETATGNRSAAMAAFQKAAETDPASPLLPLALFKLADLQQQAGAQAQALTHYLRVIRDLSDHPAARGAVRERALYQGALAAFAVGDAATANQLAGQAVVEFPNGEFRDDTRVLYGQALARLESPNSARDLLQQLAGRVDARALPEIQLALARSFLREGIWTNALAQLDDWTRSYPNHAGIARAEFERAWAAFKVGDEPRAYGLFTNYLARFPDHAGAPQAQMWVGDYLLQQGDSVAAESSYQLVFQRTNLPPSRLVHEARLMAGRAAFLRQNYKDAKSYFSWLITYGPPAVTNSLIPVEVVAQAYFALGDCFLLEPQADGQLTDAMTAFAKVIEIFPTTREALLARGKLAGCHLQRAELDPNAAASAYTNAAQLYLEVIQSPEADVASRSEAAIGMGQVHEKQAARAAPDARPGLLALALGQYLDVFHGRNLRPGETAATFWVNRAGVEAARLAESLGQREQAAALYESLARTFPASAGGFRQRAAQVRGR